MSPESPARPKILLAVTASTSLGLMRGFPEHLHKDGWDVHIASSGPALPPSDHYTHHTIAMHREPNPVYDLRSLLHWLRLIRTLRPDVVSAGTPKAGLLGTLAARAARTPVRIYKLRGLRLETSAGWRKQLYRRLERLTISSAHQVLSVSQSLTARSIALGLGPAERFTVLGSGSSNGVALDRFTPAADPRAREAFDLPREVPVVGFVGRLSRDKGILDLCEAARRLHSRGIKFHLVLIGRHEDETSRIAVQQLIAEGFPVTAPGAVPDTTRLYRAIDLLCLPTHREGFPNVVLEAGASGLPTVTTHATGAADSVIDGQTGLLVDVGSVGQLADALESLLENPERRKTLGEQARMHVAANFACEHVWGLEAEYYRSCLEAARDI